MMTNRLLLAALLACFTLPALAEEAAPVPPLPAQGELPDPEGAMRFMHRGHAPVKNAPYIAQAVSERLQQLPDGNQIERRTSAATYRDSAGRTRHEVRNAKGELRNVTISDPVAGTAWILDPQTRSAQRLPSRAEIERITQAAREAARGAREAAQGAREAARKAREAAHAEVEQLRREGRLPAHARAESGDRVTVNVERGADGRRETVRVIRVAPGPMVDGAAMGPRIGPAIAGAVSSALADGKWASKAASRDLGTRDFNGVKAEGRQRSYEIPAGEVGNRNPIVVADETWYSPELQVTVYAKHSDPRSGDYVYRLENLKRGDPDPALFTVPSDYQVREPGKRPGARNEE